MRSTDARSEATGLMPDNATFSAGVLPARKIQNLGAMIHWSDFEAICLPPQLTFLP